MPTLKPVGHQSTNWIVRLVLIVAIAALTSLGTTSGVEERVRAKCQKNSLEASRQGQLTTAVQEAASHVLAVAGVALDHLVGGLEARVGNLGNGELLVVRLLGRDDRGVGDEREVDTGVGHKVGLELGKVDVEGAVETEGRGDARDNLGNETVQVGVGRALNVEVPPANVVDGLVVNHESAVRVFEGGVGGEDRVVGLDDGGRDLRGRVDRELELGLLAIVHRQTLEQEGTETGTSTTTERVEDKEACDLEAMQW